LRGGAVTLSRGKGEELSNRRRTAALSERGDALGEKRDATFSVYRHKVGGRERSGGASRGAGRKKKKKRSSFFLREREKKGKRENRVLLGRTGAAEKKPIGGAAAGSGGGEKKSPLTDRTQRKKGGEGRLKTFFGRDEKGPPVRANKSKKSLGIQGRKKEEEKKNSRSLRPSLVKTEEKEGRIRCCGSRAPLFYHLSEKEKKGKGRLPLLHSVEGRVVGRSLGPEKGVDFTLFLRGGGKEETEGASDSSVRELARGGKGRRRWKNLLLLRTERGGTFFFTEGKGGRSRRRW